MRPVPNGANQHPIWPLPLLTCCQPCLGLFIHAWSISAGSMFGEPLHPKIEIITTGWEKRKSENVSERAYASSGPPLAAPASASLSIHSCYTVSSLFCFLQTEAAGRRPEEGWRVDYCVWSGLGGSPPVNSGKAERSSRLGSWYYLWSICAFLWVFQTQTHWISA